MKMTAKYQIRALVITWILVITHGTDEPVCEMWPDPGDCDAAILRYYHDHQTQTCRSFTYGGCGGNANNFETMSECESNCGTNGCTGGRVWKECGSSCTRACDDLDPVCDAMCQERCECPNEAPIWLTDRCVTEAQCQDGPNDCSGGQIWAECGSSCTATCDNPNPVCIAVCVERCECPDSAPVWGGTSCITVGQCDGNSGENDICSLPPVSGPCEAHMPSFYYNPVSEQCEDFIYGGCQGNANRFSTKAECLDECGDGASAGHRSVLHLLLVFTITAVFAWRYIG